MSDIVWTGDLDDDCFAEWQGLKGRAELMDTIQCRDLDDNGHVDRKAKPWRDEVWWFSVSKGGEVIAEVGDFRGCPNSGEFARWCCEQVMRRYVAEHVERTEP